MKGQLVLEDSRGVQVGGKVLNCRSVVREGSVPLTCCLCAAGVVTKSWAGVSRWPLPSPTRQEARRVLCGLIFGRFFVIN